MTIYILDNDPAISAQLLDNTSLKRQIKDIAQVLCEVHHMLINDLRTPGGMTDTVAMDNHALVPLKSKLNITGLAEWITWASQCIANYKWLQQYLNDSLAEWYYRFNLRKDLNEDSTKWQFYKKHLYIWSWSRIKMPILPQHPYVKELDSYASADTVLPFPLVMPKRYIVALPNKLAGGKPIIQPPVICYRNYYAAVIKRRIANCRGCQAELRMGIPNYYCTNWTNRKKPEWLTL
jgi:hypothetical protein